MPDARVVVNRSPVTHAGEKSIHHNKFFHFRSELRRVGIGDHQADVVPDHAGFLNPKRAGKRVDAYRRSFHVHTVRGDFRVPDAGKVRGDDRKFFAEHRQDGIPHARGFRVAVQQDQRWAVAAGCEVQLDAIDLCGARDKGLVRRVSVHRGGKGSGEEKQAEQRQDRKQVENALHGKLLVLRAHYTRIEAAGLPSQSRGFVFGAVAEGYEEDGAFAFGVGREEAGNVVVEESQAGGAEALGVSGEVELSAEDSGFELDGAIAAISEALQNGAHVGEEKDGHGGVGGQLLLQAEVTGIGAEISLLQALEHATVAVEDVGSGREPFDGVDNQVEIIELGSGRIKEIRWDAASGAVQQGGKLRKGDRGAGKFAGGTSALDDFLDGVARHLGIGQRLELNGWSGGRRKI